MKDLEWFLDEKGFLKPDHTVRYHNERNENIFQAIQDWGKENDLHFAVNMRKYDNIVFISISYIWSDILFSKPLIAIKD